MSLIENIRTMCKDRNLSIRKLEQEVGFAPRSIYKWEHSIPAVDKVEAIADYFGVSVDYVLHCDTKEITLEKEDENGKRKALRLMMLTAEGCTEEEILQAVKIMEALKK